MKLLIMQFLPTSHHLSLFGPNILISTLYLNTITLCSSLNVRDQVSYLYRNTGKIIILYILIFTFLDSLVSHLSHKTQEQVIEPSELKSDVGIDTAHATSA
jgi:hypothetical protein